MTTVNWNDLRKNADMSGGFALLDAGTYNFVVAKATAKQTGTGKDKVSAIMKVEDGPKQNATAFKDFILSPDSPGALGIFFRELDAMGLGSEFFATISPDAGLDPLAAALAGRRCVGEVTIETFNGRQQNKIKISAPLNGAQPPLPSGPLPISAAAGMPNLSGLNEFAPAPADPSIPPAPGLPF
jgi:hypothetical protein